MRRLFLLTAGAGVTLVVACADGSSTAPVRRSDPRAMTPTASFLAQCPAVTDPSAVTALIGQVFEVGAPNFNSARGKWDNIQKQVRDGNGLVAQEKVWDLVGFLLDKKGGDVTVRPAFIQLVNSLYCFVGLDAGLPSDWQGSGFIVFPTDSVKTYVSPNAQVGVQLPPTPVGAPALLVLQEDPALQLQTKLDQYPGGAFITLSTPLTAPAVVGLCPDPTLVDPVIRGRLRIGHGASTGFEILPPADVSNLGLQCAAPSASALERALETVAGLVLPKRLQAAIFDVGGVGGSASEFSPFGPVDPVLNFVGGIGGSASEFLRMAPSSRASMSVIANPTTCNPVQAAIGNPIPAACRPEVQVRTARGTPFFNVPVQFIVQAGGGAVASEGLSGSCGTFAASALVPTNDAATSRICWTVGATAGTNVVRAAATAGGDAPDGVWFSPAAVQFTATANPPTQVTFTTQPSAIIAGGTISPAVRVEVQDARGETASAATPAVTLTLVGGGSFAGVGPSVTVTAVAGVATFPAVVLTTAGTTQLVASASGLEADTSASFTVSPAAPSVMTKVAGDGQTVSAGTAVPIPPSVRVSDMYGNVIGGTTVLFAPQNNAATVTGGTQTTNAQGVATVGSWTLGDGPNALIATLAANPLIFATFSATGTSTLAVNNLCPVGGSGDEFQYPFVVPGSQRSVRQMELFLSSNGAASSPKTYQVRAEARANSATGAVLASSTVNVTLTGRNAEWLPTAFRWNAPITSGRNTNLFVTLTLLNNPDGAKVSYNTGPCGIGGCKAPRGCAVTQLNSTSLSDVRRRSVAIRVLEQ
jgi:hypothetical protein